MASKKIGELNSAWALLLKINLVILLPWCTWATQFVYKIDKEQAVHETRITALETDMNNHLHDIKTIVERIEGTLVDHLIGHK